LTIGRETEQRQRQMKGMFNTFFQDPGSLEGELLWILDF
jgi:hypothetical protein